MKIKLIIPALLLLSAPAEAIEVQAPAGFKWGQTQAQIKQQGITFEKCKPVEISVFCQTRKAPKPLSFADFYQLIFVDNRLQKVVIAGNDITDDPSGREGKELFAKVKRQLTAKYDQPSDEAEIVGLKLWDEYDEFYQCLAYVGCGFWSAIWTHDGVVGIQLKGVSRGKGWLQLIYESKDWGATVDKHEAEQDSSDYEGL